MPRPCIGPSCRSASLFFLIHLMARVSFPRRCRGCEQTGQIAGNALIVAETGREETWTPEQPVLAERQYGAARIVILLSVILADFQGS